MMKFEDSEKLIQQFKELRDSSMHGVSSLGQFRPIAFLLWTLNEYLKRYTSDSSLEASILKDIHSERFVSHDELKSIGKLISLSLDEDQFGKIISWLVNESLKGVSQRGNFFTNSDVNAFLVSKCSPEPGDIIYDPACGIGETFVCLHKKYPNHKLKFVGQEIDSDIYIVCKVNLLANGIDDADIRLADSSITAPKEYLHRANIGICDPPYVSWAAPNFDAVKFIESMLSIVDESGSVICVVPERTLIDDRKKKFRASLLANDWVESVTSIADFADTISVIVLNKNKVKGGTVCFDGARIASQSAVKRSPFLISLSGHETFESTEVPVNEILDADLRARRYALKSLKDLQTKLRETPFKVLKIRELLLDEKLGRMPRQADYRQSDQDSIPLVRVSDLAKSSTHFSLDMTGLSRFSSPLSAVTLDFDAVLFSLLGAHTNPTVFEFEGQPISIGSDVLALRLNSEIDPAYLVTQFRTSPLVRSQLELQKRGSTLPRIRRTDFLNIEVIVPPIDEQKRQVMEHFRDREKEMGRDILDEKKEAKLAEYDVISIVAHDLNHKLAAMQNDLSNLIEFIKRELPDYLERPITNVFDGDTDDEIDKVRLSRVLERLVNTRNEAGSQLAATREVLQNNSIRPSRRSFKKWLIDEIKPLYAKEVEIVVEGEDIRIDFDLLRFADLVRNLVANAKEHGATRIVFDLSKISDEDVRVVFKNDGQPFPDDFDFDTHYKGLYHRSSNSRGSGIGGYFIHKIIQLHNGLMNNISPGRDERDPYQVQIEFILPIEYQENPLYGRTNPYTFN